MTRFLRVVAIALIPWLAGCTRQGTQKPASDQIRLEVTDRGFVPAEVVVPKGKPVTLVITRKTDQTCATEIVLPRLNQRHALPLDQPVRIEIPEGVQDTLNDARGMNMLGGTIVAR